MSDEEIITHVFVCIDDIISELDLDPHPGPEGYLSLSEILTLMVLHPILKSGCSLKLFHHWIKANWNRLFPNLVEYSRLCRLFKKAQEYLVVVQQKLANLNSFGLVADGTALPAIHAARGPYAKSFRNARKVKCASKKQWYWGFLLELVIDQAGKIAFFSVSTEAEIRQLEKLLEDLANRWVLGDKGNRGKELHERFWLDKQIRIKIGCSKERNWIENVIGVLKGKLGLEQIHVRSMDAFLARVKAILCSYNLYLALNLPI
jgi:hypothetical protein